MPHIHIGAARHEQQECLRPQHGSGPQQRQACGVGGRGERGDRVGGWVGGQQIARMNQLPQATAAALAAAHPGAPPAATA